MTDRQTDRQTEWNDNKEFRYTPAVGSHLLICERDAIGVSG